MFYKFQAYTENDIPTICAFTPRHAMLCYAMLYYSFKYPKHKGACTLYLPVIRLSQLLGAPVIVATTFSAYLSSGPPLLEIPAGDVVEVEVEVNCLRISSAALISLGSSYAMTVSGDNSAALLALVGPVVFC